jgi:hypothetical protein
MIGTVLNTVRRALGAGPSYDAIEPPEEGKQYVFDHGRLGAAVNSEFVPAGGRSGNEIETVATPPIELTAKVPEKHEEGEKVKIAGPHGPIEVAPPKDSKPGDEFVYRLVPLYEFRVEVPAGAKPGLEIEVKRRDGVRVSISVPPGLKPGDIFEVLPPALIVKVPDGAKGGDYVVYHPVAAPGAQMDPQMAQLWIRTVVPEGAEPGQYFAARLPMPLDPQELLARAQKEKANEKLSPADKEGAAPLLGHEEGIGA